MADIIEEGEMVRMNREPLTPTCNSCMKPMRKYNVLESLRTKMHYNVCTKCTGKVHLAHKGSIDFMTIRGPNGL